MYYYIIDEVFYFWKKGVFMTGYSFKWGKQMSLKIDYNNMMKEFVGEEYGFSKQDIESESAVTQKAYETVKAERGTGMMGWTELIYNQKEIIKDIKLTADEIIKKADYFVVLGIGGSALGSLVIFNALCHLKHNELRNTIRKLPRIYIEDNIDPERMQALLDVLDLDKTVFNVITKSGATSETMAQYFIIMNIFRKKYGDRAREHIIATTSETTGNLIKIAKSEKFKTFYIPDGVGGRFSVFSPVGLLPAAVCGVDIELMLSGARHEDRACMNENVYENPALITALFQYMSMKKGKNISVMMPYADSLKFVADWYCQLWGESLGKAVDKDGVTVNAGQTPVKALGVTDQHSQIQLYREGPFDKVITIIGVKKFRRDIVIDDSYKYMPEIGFLCGHTLSELINTEREATEYALTKAHRLNYTILLEEVNAFTVGELLFLLEMETAFCGAMLNIDTFNQPGVESGKNATYAMFGKKGYEDIKKEIDSAPEKQEEYII